jgi:NADP-reducing hydrogenase subunit HndB
MSGEELNKIKGNYIEERMKEANHGVITVLVHMGTCGISAGATKIFSALQAEIDRLSLTNIRLKTTGCAGLCSQEPMITVEAPGQPAVRYGTLNAKKVIEIFYSHVLGGHVRSEYAISTGLEKPQKRVVGE